MAKMHSRKRGRAGSHRPNAPSLPSWVRYSAKEVEILIAKLAKEGKTSSEIGMVLRDTYGVPNEQLITKKPISVIMKEKALAPEVPEDLLSLLRRSSFLQKHLGVNKHDGSAKRGILLTESKIRRLAKYYKREGVLPESWKYERGQAGMYAE
ncbi:30S ribosomal protein S15 [Candidatus Woesearchaeota archaeon]|nr:30S ribosomal protein S15 [Candidatus Woesearchaeota archaeon]